MDGRSAALVLVCLAKLYADLGSCRLELLGEAEQCLTGDVPDEQGLRQSAALFGFLTIAGGRLVPHIRPTSEHTAHKHSVKPLQKTRRICEGPIEQMVR